MKRLPFNLAYLGTLLILSLIIVFHMLVLTGVIPYDMVWGGRMDSNEQMLGFEMISLLLNLAMMFVLTRRAKFIRENKAHPWINGIIWLMAGLFLLNTVGNLASVNELEKMIFTPVTALLCIFCVRIALEKSHG